MVTNIVHHVFAVLFKVPWKNYVTLFFASNDAYFCPINTHSNLLYMRCVVVLVDFELYSLQVMIEEFVVEVKESNFMTVVEEQVFVVNLEALLFVIRHSLNQLDSRHYVFLFTRFLVLLLAHLNSLLQQLMKLKVVLLFHFHFIQLISVKILPASLKVINCVEFFNKFFITVLLRQLFNFCANIHIIVYSKLKVDSFLEFLEVLRE